MVAIIHLSTNISLRSSLVVRSRVFCSLFSGGKRMLCGKNKQTIIMIMIATMMITTRTRTRTAATVCRFEIGRNVWCFINQNINYQYESFPLSCALYFPLSSPNSWRLARVNSPERRTVKRPFSERMGEDEDGSGRRQENIPTFPSTLFQLGRGF